MDEELGFEVVAASLRADAADMNAFLPALAVKLAGALPRQTTVKYHSGFMSKTKTVEAIDVDLGDLRFHIEDIHGRLEATCQKTVRGIVLKNDILGLDAWIDELSTHLAQSAESSDSGRIALKRMLEE